MRWAITAVAIAASSLLVAGCGDTTETASDETTTALDDTVSTSTADPGTTTTASPSTGKPTSSEDTIAAPEGNDPMDYDGQRYDFGAITRVRNPDGVVMVSFDRQQLYTDDGTLASGADFTEEPILFGNTDVPYINDSTKLRTFVLADDVEILRIADPIPCASDDVMVDPVWETVTVEAFVGGAWKDRLLDTLTFGDDGLVTRVRLSSGC